VLCAEGCSAGLHLLGLLLLLCMPSCCVRREQDCFGASAWQVVGSSRVLWQWVLRSCVLPHVQYDMQTSYKGAETRCLAPC
jgi:hypothetical protein